MKKLKKCPKCGNTDLGERWSARYRGGRKLEQFCGNVINDEWDEICDWVSEPYTPTRKRITDKLTVYPNGSTGWCYVVYDKYGHLMIYSRRYDNYKDAMKDLTKDLTPRNRTDYKDSAAPYTGILFNIPREFTVYGTMFKLKNGKINCTTL